MPAGTVDRSGVVRHLLAALRRNGPTDACVSWHIEARTTALFAKLLQVPHDGTDGIPLPRNLNGRSREHPSSMRLLAAAYSVEARTTAAFFEPPREQPCKLSLMQLSGSSLLSCGTPAAALLRRHAPQLRVLCCRPAQRGRAPSSFPEQPREQ